MPQPCPSGHVPQSMVLPQPSPSMPHCFPAHASSLVAAWQSSWTGVHTFGDTTPHSCPLAHAPQSRVAPQPSAMTPQLLPCASHDWGWQPLLVPPPSPSNRPPLVPAVLEVPPPPLGEPSEPPCPRPGSSGLEELLEQAAARNATNRRVAPRNTGELTEPPCLGNAGDLESTRHNRN